MNINKELFIEDVKKIHLNNPEESIAFDAIQDEEVRQKLSNFIDCGDNTRISMALNEICTNLIGRTMFKLLMSRLSHGKKVKITDIGPRETGKTPIEQKGSSYGNYEVKINLNVYDRYGVGIPERQYYCLDVDDLSIKRKSIAESLFHEFTHCLHHIEDVDRYITYYEEKLSALWDNKEELRTIAGYIEPDTYDPICDNCYCLYSAPRIGRYYPRLGHIGFVQGVSPDKSLEDFCRNPTFNLAWPMKYLIE
jgi:hypothetical protein